MILRIINKQTKLFIRDDFTFNPETEIGLETEPSQGLYAPKWDGVAWEESATQEYIDSLIIEPEPELDETEKLKIRLDATENALLFLMEMGGM